MISRVIIVLSLTATSYALTSLGPPTTKMQKGQFAFSAQGSWSVLDIIDEKTEPETTYSDVIIESALAGFHIGIESDRAEIYGLIGGGGIGSLGSVGYTSSAGLDDIAQSTLYTSGGGGIRITTNLGKSLSWGLVAQTVYYQDKYWQLMDTQIGLGPCWRPVINRSNGDTVMLYGGALLNFINGKNRAGYPEAKLRQDHWYGLYLGGGFEVFGGSTELLIEEMVTPAGYGASIRVKIRF